MPTYEYECRKCGHRFELFQSIKEPPRQRCPKCRGKLQRLLGTGAGLLFRGSGFYTTDYRSPDYHKAAKAERSEKPAKTPAESADRKTPAGSSVKKT